MIELRRVEKHFRGVAALSGVDLTLSPRELFGLIGPNGSGKTTLLGIASGVLSPSAGSVRVDGAEATGLGPTRFARLGVGRTFQQVRLFDEMSVEQTVMVGAVAKGIDPGTVEAVLELCELGAHRSRDAATLPFGLQRTVEVARAIAGEPTYLLLDEPAAGMNEHETDRLLAVVRQIAGETQCAVLIVDHDLRLIMRLCDRIQVLNEGSTIAVGPPEEVRNDPAVIEAYIGSSRRGHDD